MICIIDYACGNTGSISSMLRYLGVEAEVSRDLGVIEQSKGVILPGVGSFDVGMGNLEKFGLVETLSKTVVKGGKPIMGICLGAQLMTLNSEEGKKAGLGWVDIETKRFDFSAQERKLPIPHMGWSFVSPCREDPMCEGFDEFTRYYFVHSYHFVTNDPKITLLDCDYGYSFLAAFRKENIIGVQFHPEKSHRHGLGLMKNFVELCENSSRD